jgi:hypothetical protein
MTMMFSEDDLRYTLREALGNGVTITKLRICTDRVVVQVTLMIGAAFGNTSQKIIATAIALYRQKSIDHGLSLDVTITDDSSDFPKGLRQNKSFI